MTPLFVYTAIGAITIFSAAAIYLKYIIPTVGGAYQFLTVQFVIGLILHVVVLASQSIITQTFTRITFQQGLWIALASVFGFFGFLFYIVGLEVGNASVGGVVLSSRVFFSVPLAFLLVGEVYPVPIYIYILIAFIGAVLVSWQQNLSPLEVIKFQAPGMRQFLLTALFWSLQNFVIRQLNNSIPILTFLTIRMTFFTLLAVIGYYILRSQYNLQPAVVNRSNIRHLIIYVGFGLIGQIGLVYALGENLSISETIGVFEGTLTFVFSLLFAIFISNDVLKEQLNKNTLVIRIMGVILSVIGTLGTITSL